MSYTKAFTWAAAATLVARVSAHGFVTGVVADGTYYQGYNPNFQYMQTPPSVAGWSDPENQGNGPVSDYTSPDIICHLGATPGQAYATVAAGGKVELQWTAWPESHHGPMISYLANCNGECTNVDKTTLLFNKIEAAGLIDGSVAPGEWASDEMIANNNTWVTTIPSTIAPGKYVLRHETIALHSAGEVGGAQPYPQCINLEITGSGSNSLSDGTPGTALYTASEPGLVYNIYQVNTEYPIPGPTLLGAAGGSDSSTTPIATASASASTSATVISGNSSTSAVPTTFQTATRSAFSSVTISSSISTNIAVVSSTTAAATTASSSASATSPTVTVTLPGSSGTPRKFVCYEVEE